MQTLSHSQASTGNREKLVKLIEQITGTPRQSDALKQALRYASGALKSTLSNDREFAQHAESINRLMGAA